MGDIRRAGRPRSEKARVAVLTAAKELLAEGGYDSLTMEAIADRAQVGKQTVYRWWRTKSDVVSEAVLEGVIAVQAPTRLASEATLGEWLRESVRPIVEPEGASLIRALAAAAASDKGRSDALYEHSTRQSREQIVGVLQQAAEQQIVRSDVNLQTAADAIIGALLFRVLARLDIPEGYTDDLLAPYLLIVPTAR